MVLDPRRPGGACYACLVPPGEGEDAPCAVTGIFAPLAGLVGVLQAGEAIKLLCAPELAQTNQMLAIDGPAPEFRRLQLRRRPACAVCGGTSTE
jgi:adenylyltransferase/sulfurtransferase